VALAAARPPDIILIDMDLSGTGGAQLSQRLRGHAMAQRVPLMGMAPASSAGAGQGDFADGCDAYITKPVLSRQLIETLDRLLDATKG
jgi:CheY-like chemotaxis protein